VELVQGVDSYAVARMPDSTRAGFPASGPWTKNSGAWCQPNHSSSDCKVTRVGGMDLDAATTHALRTSAPAVGGHGTSPGTTPVPVLQDAINHLLALAAVDPARGQPAATAQFQQYLQGTGPVTPAELTSALQQLQATPADRFGAAMAALDPASRQAVLGSALRLSRAVSTTAAPMAQSVQGLQVLLTKLVPGLPGLPEEADLDVGRTLRSEYQPVDALAQVARPDEYNPRVAPPQKLRVSKHNWTG